MRNCGFNSAAVRGALLARVKNFGIQFSRMRGTIEEFSIFQFISHYIAIRIKFK